MPLPTVAIVGRPNVGKSTLFNRLVGKKLALVDDRPGVTRDRREGDAELLGLKFRIVDTAGFEDEDPASLPGRMRTQTEAAVREADVALFLIDAREGLTPLDEEIARWLRVEDTPVIIAANKAEGRAGESGRMEAFALGLGEPIALSAEHGEGIVDLFEHLRPHVERDDAEDLLDEDAEDGPLKLAIVGRPNAGKSTLVNRLLGEERMITGPEAGITRDSISIEWAWKDRQVRLVDTAGLRKRAKVDDKLERMSVADTLRTIDYAEVVVLLLDATRGLEVQDLKIADAVIQEGRALVIALNKWDVAEHASSLFNGVKAALEEGLSQLKGVPVLTVSAITGKGTDTILEVAFDLREQWSRRVTTGELNRWFEAATEANPPPSPGGKRIKLRYITQVKTRPPTFVIFGNRVDEVPESYRRYLLNAMRRDLKLGPIPLRLTLRGSRNRFKRTAAKFPFTLPGISDRLWDPAGVTGCIRIGATITVIEAANDIIDWAYFEKTRSEMGTSFIRVLSYFHEDGVKSIQQIEDAMRQQNAIALVIPAHTLKGEARQFGANPVAAIAELIENTARICIETKRFPDELVKDVVELRRLFDQTIQLFDKATNPLQSRGPAPAPGGFGRKVTNQGFGRL